MKDIETKLKEKFVELLKVRNLDEIDVNLLCEEINIKRQSFYYHYKNIFDLVYDIVKEKPFVIIETSKIETILTSLFNQYYASFDFFTEILSSSAREIVEEAIFSYFYKAFSSYLNKFNLGIDSKIDLSRFFSNSLTYQSIYYLQKKEYKIEEIVDKLLSFINEDTVAVIIQNYSKKI